MKAATAVVLSVIAVLGIGSALNTDLVLRRFPVETGFRTVSAPAILCLVLFAAGSWVLFLLATSVSHAMLLRKLEHLPVALDDKDRELMRAKATCFDESVETLRNVAGRLNQRLGELEPLLGGRRGEPLPLFPASTHQADSARPGRDRHPVPTRPAQDLPMIPPPARNG